MDVNSPILAPTVAEMKAALSSDIQSAIDQKFASLPTQFVTTTVMTVNQLLSTYPASADTLGKYARVSDLYGAVDDIMRCRWDGVAYRWIPQRESFNSVVATTGTIALNPLFTAPMVRTNGGLTGAVQFVPSVTNAYIGQRYRIIVNGVLGLYLATVTNLIGSNLSLLGNSAKDIEYTANGWIAVAG